MMMMMTMMNFIFWKKILYLNIYLHYLQKYNLHELKLKKTTVHHKHRGRYFHVYRLNKKVYPPLKCDI